MFLFILILQTIVLLFNADFQNIEISTNIDIKVLKDIKTLKNTDKVGKKFFS